MTDYRRTLSQQERSPIAQVLTAEEQRARRADPQDIEAAVAVREVALDVIASTTLPGDVLDKKTINALADELVKAVRAKDTRWAFIRLAGGGTEQ